MITPIIKSYFEQAKEEFKAPVNAVDIYRFYRDKAKELYKASLKESETTEDEDFCDVLEEPEKVPICSKEQEFIDYLRKVEITRSIEYIFVHCTATQPTATVSAIRKYWRDNLKWKNDGYHSIISLEGVTVLSHFDIICNGVQGMNAKGIHISYIGGIDERGKPKNTMTPLQKRYIEIFLEEMTKRFPKAKVVGHNEAPKTNKACPSFKVKDEYSQYWTGL